jgi:large subunit ribosomal protein L25
MKQRIELNVESRETGRANSRALRVAKMIPAVIYGSVEPINVSIHENDVIKYKARAFENALLNLKSTNVTKANGIVALFKEVTVNPLTRRPVHVDLFSLDLTKDVRVSVEIKIEGKAIGLAEGGMLTIVSRTVEIECLPTAIPDFITLDVTNLNVGDSIHVSDVKLDKGLKFISRPELTIVSCVEIEDEVVAAPVVAAAVAAPAAGGKAPAAAAPAAGKAAPKAPAAKK